MVFNKNKKEDDEKGAIERGGTFLSRILGARALMPFVLAAGIGTQVQNAMAQESGSRVAAFTTQNEATDTSYNTAPTASEISHYFQENKSRILEKLATSHDDTKTLNDIRRAVDLLAQNNRTHTVNITSGELGHSEFAHYAGLTNTIRISQSFRLEDPVHQSDLIHEILHQMQDAHIIASSEKDPSLLHRRRAFWNTESTPIAVSQHEQSAIEAAIIYINAMTDGTLEKNVNNIPKFAEYKMRTMHELEKKGVRYSENLASIVHRAYFYYGLKNEWPFYVQHLYGCTVGATLFDTSLQKIGKPTKMQCENLRAHSGI